MHMGQLWVSFCPARRLQVNMNGYSADPSAPSLHFRLVSVSISKTSRWQTSCEADWCKAHHSPFHIWFISWRPRRVCSWTGRKPEYLACVQIRYSQPRDLGTRIRHPPGIQPGNGKIRYIFISMCRWLSIQHRLCLLSMPEGTLRLRCEGGIMGFRACVAAVGWIPATILNIVLPATWPRKSRM